MLPVTAGARWNLRGCRCPGLVSVQSADQSLGHALKGSHHPNNIANCYLLLSENLLASLGVRPLRRGCCWRRHASSPSTPSSASAASSNHDYLHAHNQLDQQQYNQSNHVNESRSESQVAGRTALIPYVITLLVMTTTLITGAIFFFFCFKCVCARVERKQTHLTLRHHPTTNKTQPR
jgi:hypothetical protein